MTDNSALTSAEMAALTARRQSALREEILGEWGPPLPLAQLQVPDWLHIMRARLGLCDCSPECQSTNA